MEWISVKDQTPKEHAQYIVYNSSAKIGVHPAFWDGKDFVVLLHLYHWNVYENITHWTTFPDPPKQ